MEQVVAIIKTLLEKMDFPESRVEINEENRRLAISILDRLERQVNLHPFEIADFEHILYLILRRHKNDSRFIIDVNNHRREREKLIKDLAKAAAHKVSLTKSELALPSMNAFERRLIHVELAGRPDLKTESTGEGSDRHVIIKPL